MQIMASYPIINKGMLIMRWITILLIAVGSFACAQAAPEATAVPPKPRTISVSGCAIGYVQPDAVLWTIVCEAKGKNLLGAKTVSEEQVKTLIDACAKKGVQGADVSLGLISIKDASMGHTESLQDSAERFTVARTITLRQRDIQAFHDLLATVSMGTGKVSYKLYCSRVDKITRDTLLRATQAAKEKAKAMASALGASLGPVLTVSEFAPTNIVAKAEDAIVDDSSSVFSAEAEKVCVVVYAIFELQ